MCRMVGVVFRGDFPTGTLRDLQHVSEIGRVPDEDEPGHNDGWGIVSFMAGSPRYVGRSPRPMRMDPSFDSALADVPRLSHPNILIAHVRAASRGSAKMENTHPFIVDGIVLGHNGTVYDLLPPKDASPKGESDSEVLAMLVAERFEEKRDLRSALRSVIVEDIFPRKFSAAILLVSDGRKLYGYRDFTDESKGDYYDLRIASCSDHVALFQETYAGYSVEVSQLRKGELATVSLDLSIEREMVH